MEIQDLREKLAEQEHKRWIEWSIDLTKYEKFQRSTIERWKTLWIPYKKLDEEHKEKNRALADKIIKVLIDEGYIGKSNERYI